MISDGTVVGATRQSTRTIQGEQLMDGSTTRFGARFVVALAAVAMVAAVGASSASAGTGQKCPTFRVQHNDKIDGVSFPAGTYKMTVKRMACQSASDYFRQFLAGNQNDLPKGWKLFAKRLKFKNKNQNFAFRVKRTSGGGGGGGGGGGASTGRCPGTFQVLHNDRINNLAIPAGKYQIRVKRMACQSASNYFKQFLSAPGNVLPKGWKLIKPKQKFKSTNGNYSFRISEVG
jgi:hypothetical protein